MVAPGILPRSFIVRDRRLVRAAPWLLLAAAFVLRLVTLARKSLWIDEMATLQIASGNPWDIIANLIRDPHPPLYYLLMHYWIRLGQSELVLRLPSALGGALSVLLLYALMRRWGQRWAALTAALLLAIAPMHVWYSQDARMYALVCLWGLASALALTWAIRTNSVLAWGAWVLATMAGLYTHYSMLLVVLAEVVAWAQLQRTGYARRARFWLSLPALFLVALLYVPQARIFVSQLVVGGQIGSFYIIPQALLTSYGLNVTAAQLHMVTLVGGVALLCLVGILSWFPFGRVKIDWTSTGLIVGICSLYVAVLLVWAVPRGLGLKRQLLLLLPFFLAFMAAVIARHPQRLRILAALLLLTLPLTGYDTLVHQQQDWRGVARFLERQAALTDVILLNPYWTQEILEYYYHGPTPRQGVNPQSVPAKLAVLVPAHKRTWLALITKKYTDPQDRVQEWLRQQHHFQQEYSFPGVRVQVYTP